MTEAVADQAEYQDNFIILDGVKLIVAGPIRAGMASEFSTGLKIGKATYDERLHAFWIVLDDFSGGFGYRKLDIREAGGTHYDNVGGIDLRNPRHITLPARRQTTAADTDPTTIAANVHKSGAMIKFEPATDGDIVVGVGDSVYTGGGAGGPIALTHRQLLTNFERVQRLTDFIGSDGNRRIYACGTGTPNPEYFRSSDGVTWTKASDIASSGIVQITDMIVWNSQIVAVETVGNRIISSADGKNWSVDAGNDEVYRLLTRGTDIFVGTAMAPWGEPAIYFLDDGKLHVLDFDLKTAHPIDDLGDQRGLWSGIAWNGAIWVTDGLNIYEYNPGRESTVRYQGPFDKQTIPSSWASRGIFSPYPSDDDSYRIIEFVTGISDLFAVCRRFLDSSGGFPEPTMRILVYNGVGWSWYGPEVAAAIPAASHIFSDSSTEYGRKLSVVSYAKASPADTTLTYHHWRLPLVSNIPIVNWKEGFEDGPLDFEMGWFDGGFAELEGALLKFSLDGYNISTDETVKVEYRLNNDEQATYITLGTFTHNQQSLWFNLHNRLDKSGVPFKTVQFRITLNRANSLNSDVTKSPEISAFILVYDKVPAVRTAWTIRIDMSQTVASGLQIDEQPATIERIWKLLKKMHNKPTLLELKVPSLETGGVQVRITDMPATVEGFREAQGGEGTLELQLIEPIV